MSDETPNIEEFFSYYDMLLPKRLALLTGAGPESFPVISNEHLRLLKKYVGLNRGEKIVEVGCGIGRDAIPLALHFGNDVNYVGIDIINNSIEWLSSNLTTRFPNFRFCFVDINDEMHNSAGNLHMRDAVLNVESNSVDLIYLFSVATHLLKDELEVYLDLFEKWLKPGGRVFMSIFIMNDDRANQLSKAKHTEYGLDFSHHLGDGVYTQDLNRPHAAVAYAEPTLMSMIRDAGLASARDLIWGSWCPSVLGIEEPGQDIVIIKKPYQPPH